MRVRLTIVKPVQQKEVMHFAKPAEVTVGRSPNCTICLDMDPMASRMHAVFIIDPPLVRIKDLNSTNGISINGKQFGGSYGEKITQALDIVDGDEVTIGSTMFIFAIGDDISAPETQHIEKHPASEATVVNVMSSDGQTIGLSPADSAELVKLTTMFPEVPGFTIKKYLGPGKKGGRYQAIATGGEKVTIELILPETPFTKGMLERFLRDIDGVKQLEHPQLVTTLDAGAIGDANLYLVTEFVNGEDLASYLTRCTDHRINLRASCSVILQVASALAYAHGMNCLHRELAPRCIVLYDSNGLLFAKVANVGLARSLEDSGIYDCSTAVFSSPDGLGYVAPEQLTEFREAKPTVDVFSVGAILYEMLTGHVPYRFGDDEAEHLRTVADADIVSIEDRLSNLPEALVVIIDRCLSADPDDRYPNCGELLEALESVVM